MKKINKDKEKDKFEFIGKSLYFPNSGVLVLADLHVGWEESLNKQGIFVPRSQFEETMKDLREIFKKINIVDKIVIVGDLKHEFGDILSQEWREIEEVLDFLKKKSEKVILIRGNHDTILEPIARRKELDVKDFHIEDGICFLHGDEIFSECLDKKIEMIILGHRHPAVVLSDKYKKEKYKCFLVGKWKGKKIVILPSFFPFVEGGDVVAIEDNKLFIPESKLKDFEVFIVGDKTYKFGKVKRII